MARPLRIEYPGAVYHVTSRGDGRENIYLSSSDKINFLQILGDTCGKYSWYCHSYCLMNNHYHLLIETPLGNLSRGMRYLNGVYTQRFNQFHGRVGHVFQGRYKAILVEKESYLLELARYIVLNPVRANMVSHVSDWKWSSYLPTIGESQLLGWLTTDWLLSCFGTERNSALQYYKQFIQEGINGTTPWANLTNQIYLGSKEFVKEAMQRIDSAPILSEIPKIQYSELRNTKTLEEYKIESGTRNEAIIIAYKSGGYTMKEIGDYFNLHYSAISKIVNGLVSKEKGKT
jgi:putative transposase